MSEIKSCAEGICINNFKACGMKEGKYGVALIYNKDPCDVAAVFTKNFIKASPVLLDIKKIKKRNKFKALIANSGNANACVRDGLNDAVEMCKIGAEKLNIDEDEVLCASTGIIGKKLDIEMIRKITRKLKIEKNSASAASAIMTTDSKPKMVCFEYKGIKIGGIEKGAGMIAPNVATMLCFMTTNAAFDSRTLNEALVEAVGESFNMISVDGCMSTNDSVFLFSDRSKKCNISDFKFLLKYTTKEMAKMLVFDGEGATKFIEVTIKGAKTKKDAVKAVNAIINSNLVKTAFFGENPNWGRIVAAVGSRIKFDFNKVDLSFESIGKSADSVKILEKGVSLNFKSEVLKNKSIRIIMDLNSGKETATGWGCDMSYEYVKINAEYN